ncbi:hypothetical protein AG1IA_09954 [Rhizoctonia solani AG-1 IA]|uniref:Uncharacterized protein n=1 Tax=Thanatephorus cucumeris (strain AG1-IA) TaxID=983506 RepID=L8WCV8_THACA|nr:hypothetical protein AG1IA_09954 [Rhizoctonia solani AG-1 IA]
MRLVDPELEPHCGPFGICLNPHVNTWLLINCISSAHLTLSLQNIGANHPRAAKADYNPLDMFLQVQSCKQFRGGGRA